MPLLHETESGLSPLARGTLGPWSFRPARYRFIPAGAGNTYTAGPASDTRAVYPRWRGGHMQCRVKAGKRDGLSPLARGTPESDSTSRCHKRFIPAGAGNTFAYCGHTALSSVYPRWRGEHWTRQLSRYNQCGLSPLARGTQVFRQLILYERRFIPAGAGNTLKHLIRDAPRNGLSPLARGTHYG